MGVILVGMTGDGTSTPATIASFLERAEAELDAECSGSLECDVADLPGCDAASLDAIASVRLRARRRGVDLRFVGPCRELVDLVELAGLRDVLLGSALEAKGQAEEREESRGVEEERDP